MVKLDFLGLGGGKRKPVHPLANADSAREWFETVLHDYGSGAHDQVTALLGEFNDADNIVDADSLDALLVLNAQANAQHRQLCTQYLMNARMPKVMENQLRAQIIHFGNQFLKAYQRYLSPDRRSEEGRRIEVLLPRVVSLMCHYMTEYALWKFFLHAVPDNVFWLNAHHLFRYAEQRNIVDVAVPLFDGDRSSTIEDQYLCLLMISLLSGGSLTPRQMFNAYRVIRLLSGKLELRHVHEGEGGFLVNLASDEAPRRVPRELSVVDSMRFWNSTDLLETLNAWGVLLEGGHVPVELKPILEPGLDIGLLRHLAREWAPKPWLHHRAERVPVRDRAIEVAYRLPQLHRLIREPDELLLQQAQLGGSSESFNAAADLRVYGFVTSRRRERPALNLNMPGETVAPLKGAAKLPQWLLENLSTTGLGVSLSPQGSEWLALGGLIAYREGGNDGWSLGIVRRIQRPSNEKIFVGIETLTDRPVAAAIRPDEDDGPALMTLPAELQWRGGEIALFVPHVREGRKINTLIVPVANYALGRSLFMSARNKYFRVSLGKVLEKGSDWCLCELEINQQLEDGKTPR